jgi:hypothetical protein
MPIRCGLQSLDGVFACGSQLGAAEFHAASFGCRKGCFGPGDDQRTFLLRQGGKQAEDEEISGLWAFR